MLTPHAGEMARLLGCDKGNIESDPLAAAREAAARFSAVVVMKGARSYVAAPDGRLVQYPGGCAGLGTSGSGDVLAGIIAGFLRAARERTKPQPGGLAAW